MEVGLIARANQRGIGYQTQQAFEHYPFERTLLVMDGSKRWPEDKDRFPGAEIAWLNNRYEYQDVGQVKEWLDGLDVVFCVETPYDWELCDWARAAGARLVVQGNPEFYEDRPHKPDLWGWPTPWLTQFLPTGKALPVPTVPCPVLNTPSEEIFTVVHVAGHRAHGDRNGTALMYHALGHIRTKCLVRIVGQDGELPVIPRPNSNIELEIHPHGFEDRWDLYAGAHLVVLPRRYGGLSMPTLEALSAGCVVAMTDCQPNQIWPTVPLPARQGRGLRVPFGVVRLWECHPVQIARVIDRLNQDRNEWAEWRTKGADWVEANSWEHLRAVYNRAFGSAMRLR